MSATEISIHQCEADDILAPAYFYDCYEASLTVSQQTMAQIVWEIFTATPKWVGFLLSVRNQLVRPWGLKGPGSDVTRQKHLTTDPDQVPIGKRLGLFTLLEKSDNQIIIGEDDSHLDFRICLRRTDTNHIKMITVVKVHNQLGKSYMRLIEPFHRLIARTMLAKAIKEKRI